MAGKSQGRSVTGRSIKKRHHNQKEQLGAVSFSFIQGEERVVL